MIEITLLLLGLLLVAFVVATPIAALVLVLLLQRRVRLLEERLELREATRSVSEGEPSLTATRATAPHTVEIATAEIVAAEMYETAEPIAAPAAAARPDSGPRVNWELYLGRKALGWTAVVLLFLGVGFFLRYAFENAWIGPLGRVSLGVVGGAVLLLGGARCHGREQRVFASMLNAAGVVVTYVSIFSAFGFYQLLPRTAASGFLLAIVVEAAVLAVLYDTPSLALTSLLGGLVTPLLMGSDVDQYQAFFVYLNVLNVGVLLVSLRRAWRLVGTVALLGTQGLFWSWYATNYHPQKFAWAFGCQAGFFVTFLLHGILAHVPRTRFAHGHDLSRIVLHAGLAIGSLYVLLRPDYRPWLGTFAVVLAAVYVAAARFVLWRRPEQAGLLLTHLAVAIGCAAFAFPIQADAAWVALGWSAQAAALAWFGWRVRSGPLATMAALLGGIAVGRLLVVDTPWGAFREPFWPLANKYATPALGIVACLLFAARAGRRWTEGRRTVRWAAGVPAIVGLVVLWTVLSVETAGYCRVQAVEATRASTSVTERVPPPRTLAPPAASQPPDFDPYQITSGPSADETRWRWLGQMAVSIVWALYAAALLTLGIRRRAGWLRWLALALFAATTIKVLLWDTAGLREFYRILALLIVAVVLGVAGWFYQRFRPEAAVLSESES